MRVGGDDRRLPRPIGTERSLKKPPLQPGFTGGMGDAPSADSIWTFHNGKHCFHYTAANVRFGSGTVLVLVL